MQQPREHGAGPELTLLPPPARPALGVRVRGNTTFLVRGNSHACLYHAHGWHPAFFTSQPVLETSLHEYSVILLVLPDAQHSVPLRGWAWPALCGWMPGRLPTFCYNQQCHCQSSGMGAISHRCRSICRVNFWKWDCCIMGPMHL